MAIKTQYFSVKLGNIASLMSWGQTLMHERKEEVLVSMKEKHVSFNALLILDQSLTNTGDDDDELIVMEIMQSLKKTEPANMRRKINRDHRDMLNQLVTPISKAQFDIFEEAINIQNAVIVYLLVR